MAWHREYTEDEIKEFKLTIIDKLSNGEALRKILRDDENLPSRRFVYQWLDPNNDKWFDPSFSNQYTLAREESADLDAEKIEAIVEDVRNDKLRPDQARVMGDLLKWTAGRKKPKKYGDKLDLTSGGKELTQQVTVFQMPDNKRDKLNDDRDGKE